MDRLALKTRVERKEITGYVLTVVKAGPKFKESQPDNEPMDPSYKDHRGPDGRPAIEPHRRGFEVNSRLASATVWSVAMPR